MRRTTLILAGAAAFDFGVMAVAAQAQQAQASPASGPTATGQAPAGGIREIRGDQSPAGPPAAQASAVDMFIKIGDVREARACTARRGEIVRHEGSQQCRLPGPAGSPDLRAAPAPAVPAAAERSATVDLYMKMSGDLRYFKIDNAHTARACIAQRGEVVTQDGVQQCALPVEPGNNRAGPSRR